MMVTEAQNTGIQRPNRAHRRPVARPPPPPPPPPSSLSVQQRPPADNPIGTPQIDAAAAATTAPPTAVANTINATEKSTTPSHQLSDFPTSSPSSASRLAFLARDTQAGITELDRLEEETRRRHREFRDRIASTERRMGAWTARLGREVLDREASTSSAFRRSVARPIGDVADRFVDRVEGDFVGTICADDGPLVAAEERMAKLSKALVEFEHGTVVRCVEDHLVRAVERVMDEEIGPEMELECAKADKREAGMVHRFDELAARSAGDLFREEAERISSLHVATEQVRNLSSVDERRTAAFLGRVRELRDAVAAERKERQRRDQMVLDEIIELQRRIQTAMLESVGGDGNG